MLKKADLGWKKEPTNITNKFLDLDKKQAILSTVGVGAFTGGVPGAAAAYLLASAMYGGGRPAKQKLPDFDPLTGYYIGQAYSVPLDYLTMKELHKRMVGSDWLPSVPGWLLFLMSPKGLRVRASIRLALLLGKANTRGLSRGLLASLAFPAILRSDGSVISNRTWYGSSRAPVKGFFDRRAITKLDIDLYNRSERSSK